MEATKKHELSLKKYVMICTLIALLVVIIGVFASKELIGRALHNGKVLSKKQAASQQLDRNLEAAPRLVDSYRQLGPGQPVLAAALPNGADFSGLVALLETAAADAGIRLTSVTPATATADDEKEGEQKPEQLRFVMATTGSYVSLQSFMRNLEMSARPIRVDTMQITGVGSSLSVSIGATSYYQPKASLKLKTEYVK